MRVWTNPKHCTPALPWSPNTKWRHLQFRAVLDLIYSLRYNPIDILTNQPLLSSNPLIMHLYLNFLSIRRLTGETGFGSKHLLVAPSSPPLCLCLSRSLFLPPSCLLFITNRSFFPTPSLLAGVHVQVHRRQLDPLRRYVPSPYPPSIVKSTHTRKSTIRLPPGSLLLL